MPSRVELQKYSLSYLDEDVFFIIANELRSGGHLQNLSLTCKSVRLQCIDVLFRECSVKSASLSSGKDRFIPEHLWPHIRVLQLHGRFDRSEVMLGIEQWYHIPKKPKELLSERDALRREARAGVFLAEVIAHLSALHTVVIDLYRGVQADKYNVPSIKVGVPASVIAAIFSHPHLCHFTCQGYLFHPLDSAPQPESLLPLPPLTVFEHKISYVRGQPRAWESEAALLNTIVPELHTSLEVLRLPSENAPLRKMFQRDWPALRELRLEGQRRTVARPFLPYITLLARMPRLRRLHLLFANPQDIPPQAIWPVDYSAHYPWPELEELTITHPTADDQLWRHLPASLRSIALRCWPRFPTFAAQMTNSNKYFRTQLKQARVLWQTPLLTDVEMLSVLTACKLPVLRKLELEYVIDSDAEELLFRHIVLAFPNLEVLILNGYHNGNDPHLRSLKRMAEILSPLKELRSFTFHFDRNYDCLCGTQPTAAGDVRPYLEPEEVALILAENMGATLGDVRVSSGGVQPIIRTFCVHRAGYQASDPSSRPSVQECGIQRMYF